MRESCACSRAAAQEMRALRSVTLKGLSGLAARNCSNAASHLPRTPIDETSSAHAGRGFGGVIDMADRVERNPVAFAMNRAVITTDDTARKLPNPAAALIARPSAPRLRVRHHSRALGSRDSMASGVRWLM